MAGLFDELLVIFHGIWNRRWIALAVAWGVCMLGWLGVALIPNSYQSKARVYVNTQSLLEDKIGITQVQSQQDLDRLRQTLASAENLEKVVRGTDLSQGISGPRDMAAKISALRENISIMAQADPSMIDIIAVSADSSLSDGANARIAQQVAQKMIDIFQEANLTSDRAETKQSLSFLDQQIAERGKQLAAAEQRRAEFEQRFVGLLPGAGSIGQRMDAARQEISNIDSQLVQAQSALSAMNGQLAGTPQSLPGVGASGGPSALAQAQAELSSMRSRGWTSDHPDVIAMQRQVDALRRQGGGGSGTGAGGTPNPAYLSLKSMQADRAATVQALNARKAQLQSDLNVMTSRQTDEPGVAAEQEKLARDYDVLKTQYDKLLSDREEIRLRGEVKTETGSVQFRVIQPPSAPTAPVAPNRPLLLIGVLVLGIGAGVGVAFAIDQLKGTFPTAARLERAAGLPVIGSISQALNAGQVAIERQRLKWFAGASGGLAAVCLLLIAVEFIQRGMA
ncbi:polysaccharide chain length determinant protein (PEP-CTERM system associated) [Sphingobium wenxiniae]|uniref:Chain-length determining protein n=2 Tax=Sphingobium TaxID=165695 RepID=T0HEQ1_9SPHN|nr:MULTISPECIES: XrtA system polysaccharide chain length determinant [Sphingobium]EQA97854.1 chain-length determining protein [Sphingobium baderi LL03]KMS63486.1 chain-length determining protein [Sphingobium baderi LL03]MBB6189996.1 polysaccharide chain length determinant protein (PEP-CTERM system associated) [Sphingobium wenxiniae]TWH97689.1 polysaccharide chain length determinant protein (PEP-CTERM system associated) [Sphingobium wenxiniae]WRD77281.1 Wzz/FepE/Etk N-terminal domain-containing